MNKKLLSNGLKVVAIATGLIAIACKSKSKANAKEEEAKAMERIEIRKEAIDSMNETIKKVDDYFDSKEK